MATELPPGPGKGNNQQDGNWFMEKRQLKPKLYGKKAKNR